MTNTKRYIADAMSAMLNNDSDRAIGLLLRASLAYDDEFAEKQWGDDSLPPIQPLNDKPKRVSPADVKCPTCQVLKGKPCVKVSNRGGGDAAIGMPLAAGKFHAERRRKVSHAG